MANGILVIDKSAGWTSQDVAAKLRGVFHERRVGHGGTLDPMATGVLPVFIGRATRAAEFLESAEKEYVAGLRLGVVTDTQDTSGTVLETNPVCVTRAQLEAALRQFLGPIEQLPPMYSAIKINGQKLYELARRGQEVARRPRSITIHALELLEGEEDARCYLALQKWGRGRNETQTEGELPEPELQQRAAGDHGADEGHARLRGGGGTAGRRARGLRDSARRGRRRCWDTICASSCRRC